MRSAVRPGLVASGREATRWARPWAAAAAAVGLAWLGGLVTWRENLGDLAPMFPEIPFSLDGAVFVPLVGGLATTFAVGFVRGFIGIRLLGSMLLALTTAGLAGIAFFSSFGDFCIDPGEACLVGVPTHAAGLLVPVACLAGGWLAEAFFRARGARHVAT